MNTLSQDTHSKSFPARQAASGRRGFTLVEIMAATGIMVAVILLVLSLTGNVLNTWNFSSDRLAQNYEARIGLDFLNQDLEAAYFNSRGLAWMEARYVTVGQAAFQTQLFFFCAVTDRDRSRAGDYCTVGYATAFQNPFDPEGSNSATEADGQKYGLYRKVVDAETTFDDVMSMSDFPTDKLYSSYWQSISGNGDGQLLSDDNYLSANVVNFQIIFYYYDENEPNQARRIKAITSDGTASGTPWAFVVADGIYISQSPDGSAPYSTHVDGHLVYADVKMTVLGDEGANMVDTGHWDEVGMDWDQFKDTYGQTFTRRVYIMSEPL